MSNEAFFALGVKMVKKCFIFCVHGDEIQSLKLIHSIKEFFDDSDIICIIDGVINEDFIELLKKQEIKYIAGDRLKPQKYGGAWLKRIFQSYLKHSGSDLLIKIDPDSIINRAFNFYQKAQVAGTIIELPSGNQIVHGGCVLFKRDTVTQIINSNLLDNSKYKLDRRFGYQRYEPPYLQPGEVRSSEWIISGDAVLADIIRSLDIGIEDWTEVSCGVYPVSMNNNKWAIFHPLKYLSKTPTNINGPDWDKLVNELRGSSYFAKVFSAANNDLTVNTAYTTILSSLSFRAISDLAFSLKVLKQGMGEQLSPQDINEVNALLADCKFPISL